MAGGPCRQCRAELPAAANYCPRCGAAVGGPALDPLGVETVAAPDAPPPSESRLGVVVGIAVAVGVAALLWSLASGGGDEPAVEGDAAGAAAASLTPTTTSTTTSTTAPPTTEAEPPSTTAAGLEPVLPGSTEVLVAVRGTTMQHVELGTGEVTTFELEESIQPEPESSLRVGDGLVSYDYTRGERLVVTDLYSGEQQEVPVPDAQFGGGRVLGSAGPASVWLAGWDAEPVLEVAVDGRELRRVEVPVGFWPRSARGDEVVLEGIGGSFAIDAATGDATEIAGTVVAEDRVGGARLTVDCGADLRCQVLFDDGSTVSALLRIPPEAVLQGSAQIAPGGDRMLVRSYLTEDAPLQLWDLENQTVTDLGDVRIEPYLGIAWLPDSPWAIARGWSSSGPAAFLAIDTATGEVRAFDLGSDDRRDPYSTWFGLLAG